MQRPPLISLTSGTVICDETEARLKLQFPRGTIDLDTPTPGLHLALLSLANPRLTEDERADQILEADGMTALARYYSYLGHLRSLGLLSYAVVGESGPLLTLEPISPDFRFDPPTIDLDEPYVLSRFAYCRRRENALVIESPLALARAILHGAAAAGLLAELSRARPIRELTGTLPGINEAAACDSVSMLAAAGMVCAVRADGTPAEDDDVALAQWEFHDLLFHARSRPGRHDSPSGATYRFLGRIDPAPTVKSCMSDEVVLLSNPDLSRLMEGDISLTRAIEERTSLRDHGEKPLTSEQVGELLYRTSRVRSVSDADAASDRQFVITSRPYPSSGAGYELEIYLTIDACRGIAPGLYHYQPHEHQLEHLSAPTTQTAALLRAACVASGMVRTPQILMTVTARFQRLSWKYESIAYSAVLKDVGVLYQTIYLVATSMGLASCALGSGNSDLFGRAAGLRYLEESSVGEFLVGSRC